MGNVAAWEFRGETAPVMNFESNNCRTNPNTIDIDSFTILTNPPSEIDLPILESPCCFKLNPVLVIVSL